MVKLINMMKKDSILQSHIKLIVSFLIIFICSCSSVNSSTDDKLTVVRNLDKFIEIYQEFAPNSELKGILVFREDNGYYISDAPEEVLLVSLKNQIIKKGSSKVGLYKGILCEYYAQDIKDDSLIFKEPDFFLKNRATVEHKVEYNGQNLVFDYGLLEWDPHVKIIFNIRRRNMEIFHGDKKYSRKY